MRVLYIADMRENGVVDDVFCVMETRRRPSKRGPYAALTLCDRTGTIEARKWSLADAEWEALGRAQYVRISGAVEAWEGKLQVRADTLSPAPPPASLSDFLPTCPGDRAVHWDALCAMVTSLHDPFLHALMQRLFGDVEFRRRYAAAPAAQRMHHAYRGGLLEHSLEVATLCMGVAERIPTLRRDLLLAGALLHDVGKLQELECDAPGFAATMEGGLLGHVSLGMDILGRAMDGIPGFPPTLRAAVQHMVLAHHGKLEWGAPVLPALPEALVLADCDHISAQMAYARAGRAAGAAGPFTTVDGWPGRLYVGDIELSEAPPAQPPLKVLEDRPALRILAGGMDGGDGLPEMIALPIVGSVAAGSPISVETHTEGYLAAPLLQKSDDKDFLLHVTGDSMMDAHILDGDLVRVKPTETASEGDVVVAVRNGDVTVKRYHKEAGRVILQAQNPDYPDIPIAPNDDFRIWGKVVGLLRNRVA